MSLNRYLGLGNGPNMFGNHWHTWMSCERNEALLAAESEFDIEA